MEDISARKTPACIGSSLKCLSVPLGRHLPNQALNQYARDIKLSREPSINCIGEKADGQQPFKKVHIFGEK